MLSHRLVVSGSDVGFLAGGSYQNEWRNTEARARNFNFPEERTDDEDETTRSITMADLRAYSRSLFPVRRKCSCVPKKASGSLPNTRIILKNY